MKLIISIESHVPQRAEQVPSGSAGFIGWHRLAEMFWKFGELTSNETGVTHFVADERGLTFFVKRTK